MHIVKNNWSRILLLILSGLIVYWATFTPMTENSKSRLDSSFKQALGVFATAKALNAVISLVQGTEVGPPGVTISIGEVLDPINDLVERFSWIMLASLTSLGIQKIMMNIVTCNGFDVLLIFTLLIVNFLYFFKLEKISKEKKIFYKVTVILIFLRFCIPFMTLANEYVYVNFVKQDYNIEVSQKMVNSAKEGISKFDEKESSFFSTDYYKQKMVEFEKLSNDVGDHIVDLIIVFIFQTMLFPIIFLYFLYRLVSHLFNITM